MTESEPDDSTLALDRNRGLYRPERLLTLVDGVFAISMTLLALDVRIPDNVPDTSAGFASALGLRLLLGRVGVFVAAFVITSRFWLMNHRYLAGLRRVDRGLLQRSILFLAAITTLPVATGVLFRFGAVPGAIAFAAVVLALTSALSGRVWWYVSSPERDLATVDPDERRRGMVRTVLVVVTYLLAIPIAYAVPPSAVAYTPLVWFLLAVVDAASAWLSARLRPSPA